MVWKRAVACVRALVCVVRWRLQGERERERERERADWRDVKVGARSLTRLLAYYFLLL